MADVLLMSSYGRLRLYTQDDIDRILIIRRMKPLGFTLEEMRAVMADIETLGGKSSDASGAHHRLALIQEGATQRRARLTRQLDMADEFIEILSEPLIRGTFSSGGRIDEPTSGGVPQQDCIRGFFKGRPNRWRRRHLLSADLSG